MTPQERAAYVYAKLGRGSVPDIKTIYEHTQATRRAALLEAAQVAITHGEQARDEDLSGSYTSELIAQALTRLAQEG